MVNHYQYVLFTVVGGRYLHNQVNRYLCESSSWYFCGLQLILVTLHLHPFTRGTAVYMAMYVFIILGQ